MLIVDQKNTVTISLNDHISGTELDVSSGEMKFSVVEVANSIQQELHTVHTELSCLQNPDLNIEFTDPVFHIRSPGDLSTEELNKICDYLCEKMKEQEQRQLEKLYLMHAVLQSESQRQSILFDQEDSVVNSDSDIIFSDESEEEEIPSLRTMTQQYFSNEGLDQVYLERHNIPVLPMVEKITPERKRRVENDVKLLVASEHQHKFTGRTVARIFHGILSPRFSALWGCKNEYWRRYLDINFDCLCEIATKKLLKN